MELRRQGKTEVLGEIPVPVRIFPLQIPIEIRSGSKQSLRGDLPVINGLSRGTVSFEVKVNIMYDSSSYRGDRGGTMVKLLFYKSEGRWFEPSWCHWNFSLT